MLNWPALCGPCTGQNIVDFRDRGDIDSTLNYPLNASGQEVGIIAALMLEQYHDICYWELSLVRRIFSSSAAPLNMGSVYYSSADESGPFFEIATFARVEILSRWQGDFRELMEDGWIRYFPLPVHLRKMIMLIFQFQVWEYLVQLGQPLDPIHLSS